MKTNTRAFAFVPVLLVIAAVTGVAWIAKPSLFPGSSRRAADTALTVAAATEHASSVQKLGLLCAAVLALCLWVYSKIYGITPATLGTVVADIRAGAAPIQALDTNLAPWMHPKVARAAKLATPQA